MVAFFRVANYCHRKKKQSRVNLLWTLPVLIIYRFLNEFIFFYEIPAATKIGHSLLIDHGYGIVINKHSVIGNNCRIKHNVTIGCKTLEDGSQGPSPVIGNNVDIGAYAILIGDIEIGDNVKIGAGAIVTKSVASNSTIISRQATIL